MRSIRASEIYALAENIFGNKEKASRWLHTPLKVFDGKCPIDMIKTEAGTQLVEEHLNQIDAGYFS